MAARDELGRFMASVDQAEGQLRDFSPSVSEGTRAAGERAQADRDSLTQRAAGLAGSAGVGGASRALSTAGAAGDLDAGVASIIQSTLGGVRSLPGGGAFLDLSGAGRAERVIGSAAERTAGVTTDLARYGIEVDPAFRQGLIDTALEQENRVERERARVQGAAFSGTNVAEQTAKGASDNMGQLVALVSELAGILRGLRSGGAS